ncbi:MAG: hypothetical protein ACLQI7_14040 [Streptosporangiaceae bacterium]|jgi:hypothetical protein
MVQVWLHRRCGQTIVPGSAVLESPQGDTVFHFPVLLDHPAARA